MRLKSNLRRACATPPAELARQCPDRLRRCCDDLLGLGLGLTPSGDDILIGAMLALQWLSPELGRTLSGLVASGCQTRTSAISAAHLRAASRGQAIAPLHAVLVALSKGDRAALGAAREALLDHGAHSGADALSGLNCAIAAYLSASKDSASSCDFARLR